MSEHTPGPWDWFANHRGDVMLATPDRGRLIVMDFARNGMNGATPRFAKWSGPERGRLGGIMHKAADLIDGGVLLHPDALLIAAAPDLLRELEHLVRLMEPVEPSLNIPGLATLNGARAALAKARAQ